MVPASNHNMAMRLLGAIASLVLQVACVDRAMGDAPAPYDPEADERTNAEILQDFCEFYVACKIDAPVLDMPMCLWYHNFINTGFETSPEKSPECAVALWDRLACVSEADSCEGFRTSLIAFRPYTDRRCAEPFERFDAADCAE